jgi:hypothetical protein
MIHTVGNDSKYKKFKILLNLYLGKCAMEPGRVFGLKCDPIRPNHGAQFWEARVDRFSTLALARRSRPSASWPASLSCELRAACQLLPRPGRVRGRQASLGGAADSSKIAKAPDRRSPAASHRDPFGELENHLLIQRVGTRLIRARSQVSGHEPLSRR